MAMAPKENATDHTVWTSVYLDALVSSAFLASQDLSLFFPVQIYKFASKRVFFDKILVLCPDDKISLKVVNIKSVSFCLKYYFLGIIRF